MSTVTMPATRRTHTNVLNHLMGFLKGFIDADAKQELIGLIEDYRRELVPLTLLKHHVAMHNLPEWVHQQLYLNPCPKELLLRNLI
jgi:uncharacterized protein YbgA (DUF1722 family)